MYNILINDIRKLNIRDGKFFINDDHTLYAIHFDKMFYSKILIANPSNENYEEKMVKIGNY